MVLILSFFAMYIKIESFDIGGLGLSSFIIFITWIIIFFELSYTKKLLGMEDDYKRHISSLTYDFNNSRKDYALWVDTTTQAINKNKNDVVIWEKSLALGSKRIGELIFISECEGHGVSIILDDEMKEIQENVLSIYESLVAPMISNPVPVNSYVPTIDFIVQKECDECGGLFNFSKEHYINFQGVYCPFCNEEFYLPDTIICLNCECEALISRESALKDLLLCPECGCSHYYC